MHDNVLATPVGSRTLVINGRASQLKDTYHGCRRDDSEKVAGVEWISGRMSPCRASAPCILCEQVLRLKCGLVAARDKFEGIFCVPEWLCPMERLSPAAGDIASKSVEDTLDHCHSFSFFAWLRLHSARPFDPDNRKVASGLDRK
jgi:hypothetical protein